MRLTERQTRLIRESFHAVSGDAAGSAASFYAHLYRIAPQTEHLFVADMTRQGAKLMSTLAVAVGHIDDWSTLRPVLEDLAMRHLAYGVRAEHYPVVGEALQAMFAERLGEVWTPEAAAAWADAYSAIQQVMVEAAYPLPADDAVIR